MTQGADEYREWRETLLAPGRLTTEGMSVMMTSIVVSLFCGSLKKNHKRKIDS